MARKFEYKHRSHFDTTLLRIAEYEMDRIDAFFGQSKRSLREEKALKQRVASSGRADNPDDRWVDDFAQLEEFAWLSSEFAIIGLWRCVELYRKDAIRHALGDDNAIRCFLEKNPKYTHLQPFSLSEGSSKIEGRHQMLLEEEIQAPLHLQPFSLSEGSSKIEDKRRQDSLC